MLILLQILRNVRIQAYIRVQQIIPNASMKWDLTDVAATKDTGNCGVVNTEIRILIVLVSTTKKQCSMIR